jgi:hypothetical protein
MRRVIVGKELQCEKNCYVKGVVAREEQRIVVMQAAHRCNAKDIMRKEQHEKSNARKETQKLQCKSNAKSSVRGVM